MKRNTSAFYDIFYHAYIEINYYEYKYNAKKSCGTYFEPLRIIYLKTTNINIRISITFI